MSQPVGEAIVELRADVDRLRADIDRAGSTSGKGFASRFREGIAPLGALVAGVGVASFFKDAVSGASDLNETLSKTQVVFGSGSDAVVRYASQGAAAIGQTKQEALDAASTFGIFGKMAGLSGKDLAGFSTQFTGLATDLASFHNTSPQEAIEAIGAALRGEAEPIRRYGVLMDDASLRQQALRLGLIKTTKDALTPQQKVLAAQALIMKQTKDAQGDFQRTSGGLANQQRILSSSFVDLRTKIGSAFLPVVLAAVRGLNGLFGIVEGLGPVFEPVVGIVQRFTDGLASGAAGAGGLQATIAGLGAAFRPVGAALGGMVSSLLPTIRSLAAEFMATLLPGIQSIANVVTTQFLPAFTRLIPVITPIARLLLQMFGSAVIGVIKGAIQAIVGAVTVISGVIRLVVALIHGDWSGAWKAFGQIVKGALGLIIGLFKVWWNAGILSLFRGGIVRLLTAWRGFFKGAEEGAVSGLRNLVGKIAAGFTRLVQTVARLLLSGIKTYLSLWRGLFTTFISLVRSGAGLIRGAFTALLRTVLGILRSLWTAAAGVVRTGVSNVASLIGQLPGRIAALGGRMLSAAKSIGSKIIAGIMDGLRSAGGFVGDLVNSIRSAINGALHLPFTIHGPGPLPDFTVPAFAAGTMSAPGGVATVGEHGRELVYLPRGSRVLGNAQTEQRLAGREAPAPVFNIYAPTADPAAIASAVAARWVLAGLPG